MIRKGPRTCGSMVAAALVACVIPIVVGGAAHAAAAGQLWGVDTTETITQSHVDDVKSASGGAVPKVWGRYVSNCLPGSCGGNMTLDEVATAKANGIAILLISADIGSSDAGRDMGSANGTADGKLAVADAKSNANAPAGTLIIRDIESLSSPSVDAAFLGAWYTAVKSAGYLPGFYLNPTHSDVAKAFCGAQSTPGFSSAIIDSFEPEPSGASIGPSGAPPLSDADHFSCAGGVYDVYQYTQATAIGTNFDEDVFAADTPGLLGGSVIPPVSSSSSSVVVLPDGHLAVGFRAAGSGLLWSWNGALNTTGNGTATAVGIAAGTTPSIAVLPSGNLVMAFHANDGYLWTWTGAINTAGHGTPTGDGMAAGTSPSLAVLPDGKLAVAFNANGGKLWTWTGAINTGGNGTATADGEEPGTSPSLAVLGNGHLAVAFQANSSERLWTWNGALNTTGNGTATYDGMAAGTSPSLTVLPNQNLAVAFQANGGKLWTWNGALNSTGNGTPTYDGVQAGTSPSLGLLANGHLAVAFHAASGLLWTWNGALNSTGNGTATYDGMTAGSSPSLAVLLNGNLAVAFKADSAAGKTPLLWTWTGALNSTGNGTATNDGME